MNTGVIFRHIDRLLFVTAGAVALLVVVCLASKLLFAPCLGWNDLRLAPIVYYFQAEEPVFGEEPGKALTVLYGPMMLFSFSPAALGSNPEMVCRLGVICAWIFGVVSVFAPAILITKRLGWESKRGTWFLFIVLCAAVVVISRTLSYGLMEPHADSPALAFLTVAAVTVAMRPKGWVWITALACGLAASCKVTYAAPAIGLVLFVVVKDGWRWGCRLVVAGGVTGVLLVILWAGLFDAAAVWDAVVSVPGSHPWILYGEIGGAAKGSYFTFPGRLLCLAQASLLLLLWLVPWVCVWVLARMLVEAWQSKSEDSPVFGRWAGVCATLVLFGLAPAALGLVKSGGDVNTLAVVLLFVFQLVALSVAKLLRQGKWESLGGGLVVFCLTALIAVRLVNLTAINLQRQDNEVYQKLTAELAASPGEVWCPTRPLAHWFHEGKVTHSGDVLYCYVLGGRSLDTQWLGQYLPEKTSKMVGFRFDPWLSSGFDNLLPPEVVSRENHDEKSSGILSFDLDLEAWVNDIQQKLTGER